MNDRVLAIKEFSKLSYNRLDTVYMFKLHVRIFSFSMRCICSSGLDIYVDIKSFIEDGIERIQAGEETWYKQDFINAGLIK